MVLLAGAFTITSVIIFFLGIFMGKEIESRKIVQPEEPLVKLPVKPSAGAGAALSSQSKDELTFYDTLKRPPSETGAEGKRQKAGKTEAKPKKAEAKDNAPGVGAGEKKTPASPETGDGKTSRVAPEPKGNGKTWTVQVNAYPDEASAKQLVEKLKGKGYNAGVTEFQNNGKTWYRVRVGKYATREDADKALETLKRKENFPSAFAASR
jgi:cell division protein FtsN